MGVVVVEFRAEWSGSVDIGERILGAMRRVLTGRLGVDVLAGLERLRGFAVVNGRRVVHGNGVMTYVGRDWPFEYDVPAAAVMKPGGLLILAVGKGEDGRVTDVAATWPEGYSKRDLERLAGILEEAQRYLYANVPEHDMIPTWLVEKLEREGVYIGTCDSEVCMLARPEKERIVVIMTPWKPNIWVTTSLEAKDATMKKYWLFELTLPGSDIAVEIYNELREALKGATTAKTRA